MSFAPALATFATDSTPVPAPQRVCTGPLEFLRGIVQKTPMSASLRFEAVQALDEIRETLEMREQQGLEYVFARVIMEVCFAPVDGSERTWEFLIDRFRRFDRRKHELALPGNQLPLICREQVLKHVVDARLRRATLFRAIHLAAAIDCDGPWTQSEEKQAILSIMAKVLAGATLR